MQNFCGCRQAHLSIFFIKLSFKGIRTKRECIKEKKSMNSANFKHVSYKKTASFKNRIFVRLAEGYISLADIFIN